MMPRSPTTPFQPDTKDYPAPGARAVFATTGSNCQGRPRAAKFLGAAEKKHERLGDPLQLGRAGIRRR